MHWQQLVDAAGDLVTASSCAGCTRPGRALCDGCAALLVTRAALRWPDPRPAGLPPPYAVADYDGPVRSVLLAHKEHARYGLARPLGAALAQAVAAAVHATGEPGSGDPVLLVPPPSRGAVVRGRGHDPVLRMARRAAALLRSCDLACLVVPALRLGRSVADQAELGAAGRAQNLAGAYQAASRHSARLARGPVVVVDDVITTGATAGESARAIRSAGGAVAAVAVVAATRRRLPHHPAPPHVGEDD